MKSKYYAWLKYEYIARTLLILFSYIYIMPAILKVAQPLRQQEWLKASLRIHIICNQFMLLKMLPFCEMSATILAINVKKQGGCKESNFVQAGFCVRDVKETKWDNGEYLFIFHCNCTWFHISLNWVTGGFFRYELMKWWDEGC